MEELILTKKRNKESKLPFGKIKMMEIVWSDETLKKYFKVLDYLFNNWSLNEIENFENNFDGLIERIKTNKEICPKSKILNFRKCLIDKNNSLIYQ